MTYPSISQFASKEVKAEIWGEIWMSTSTAVFYRTQKANMIQAATY